MSETLYKRLQCRFAPQAGRQWGHLSRMTNLLIVLNVSLFFLTNLVTQQGYYYTFYSIFSSHWRAWGRCCRLAY